MILLLLPDLGDLLRVQPQYNAATIVELALAAGAREVLWLGPPDPDHPARDTLAAAGLPVRDLAPDWAWADAEYDALLGYLNQYPQARPRLRAAAEAQAALAERLSTPQTLESLSAPELLDALRAYHAATAAALDEGPGTRWQEKRLDRLAERLTGLDGVALAPLDDLPGLLDRLPGARLPAPQPPGEASRLRALADRAALMNEHDDPEALLAALARETGDALTPRSELDYHAANLYLAAGQLNDARDLLERSAHALKGERSLPGLVLARLGQVRDAQGERDLAVRAYRATLALSTLPQVAREAAAAGLETPFVLASE